MVFIASTEVKPLISLSFIIAFMITLIISFIVTKIISNKIVKPIYDLETFAENIANHKWDVNVIPVEVTGNSEALLTAFENLIENQIRYDKSVIGISIKKGAISFNSSVVIKFTNDGPHFNQENPMCLFQRYKKDESGQWGLGLTIVKQIIEAHSGNVIAQNTEEGVEFVVTLQI